MFDAMEALRGLQQSQGRGRPTRDLMPVLGKYLWQPQVLDNNIYDKDKGAYVSTMVLSNRTQYYWKLPCEKHLVYQGIQAAKDQLEELGHMSDCIDKSDRHCIRCKNGYKGRGYAQPSSRGQRNQSYFVQTAWLALDTCLVDNRLVHDTILQPASDSLTGPDFGYVVEAKILGGTYGAADIYVPLIDLIIQVDGQSHDHPTQKAVDARFDNECMAQGRNVLRLHWYKDLGFHMEIWNAINQVVHSKAAIQWPPFEIV